MKAAPRLPCPAATLSADLQACRAHQAQLNALCEDRQRPWFKTTYKSLDEEDRAAAREITHALAGEWDQRRRLIAAYAWSEGKRPDKRHLDMPIDGREMT